MKLYAKENQTDPDMVELYYYFMQRKCIFTVITSDCFDEDIQEALLRNTDEAFDLELELKLR